MLYWLQFTSNVVPSVEKQFSHIWITDIKSTYCKQCKLPKLATRATTIDASCASNSTIISIRKPHHLLCTCHLTEAALLQYQLGLQLQQH